MAAYNCYVVENSQGINQKRIMCILNTSPSVLIILLFFPLELISFLMCSSATRAETKKQQKWKCFISHLPKSGSLEAKRHQRARDQRQGLTMAQLLSHGPYLVSAEPQCADECMCGREKSRVISRVSSSTEILICNKWAHNSGLGKKGMLVKDQDFKRQLFPPQLLS